MELSTGDGVKTLTVRATDVAGNVKESSLQFRVDQVVENATAKLSAHPNAAGWYKAVPTVSLTPPAAENKRPDGTVVPYDFGYHFDFAGDTICTDPCRGEHTEPVHGRPARVPLHRHRRGVGTGTSTTCARRSADTHADGPHAAVGTERA